MAKKRMSDSTKRKVYSLILIFLMVSSAIAFVAVYYAGGGSDSYGGYDIYQTQNGGYLLAEYNLPLVNHPRNLGLEVLGLNEEDKIALLANLNTAAVVGVGTNSSHPDASYYEQFNFALIQYQDEIFEGTQFDFGDSITCESEYDMNIVIEMANQTQMKYQDNCLRVEYTDIYALQRVLENLLLYRAGVLN